MSALVWGVKASLLGYVRGMSDGRIELDGVTETAEGFVFAADAASDSLRFSGAITLIGHGGMMHVRLGDPWVVRAGEGAELSIADPDDPAARLPFARIARLTAEPDGTLRAEGTTMTSDAADLFFGPYTAGTSLDDPVVTP